MKSLSQIFLHFCPENKLPRRFSYSEIFGLTWQISQGKFFSYGLNVHAIVCIDLQYLDQPQGRFECTMQLDLSHNETNQYTLMITIISYYCMHLLYVVELRLQLPDTILIEVPQMIEIQMFTTFKVVTTFQGVCVSIIYYMYIAIASTGILWWTNNLKE